MASVESNEDDIMLIGEGRESERHAQDRCNNMSDKNRKIVGKTKNKIIKEAVTTEKVSLDTSRGV